MKSKTIVMITIPASMLGFMGYARESSANTKAIATGKVSTTRTYCNGAVERHTSVLKGAAQ